MHFLLVMTISVADFSEHPMSVSVNRGDEVTLNCTYPLNENNVNISWSGPNNVDLTLPMTTSVDGSTSSTIMLTAANSSYSGNYICTARYDNTTVISATATLTVNCKSLS